MTILNVVGKAMSLDWPDPTPIKQIKKELSPVMAMTSEMIPEPYREWLTDISDRMQCPLDYVAVTAIVTTAAVIGAGCHIRPKRQDNWTVVPNLWGGIVGRPSTLKSPSLKEVMKPLRRFEEEARVAFEKEKQDSFNITLFFKGYNLVWRVHHNCLDSVETICSDHTNPYEIV